jgi:Alginate lyase
MAAGCGTESGKPHPAPDTAPTVGTATGPLPTGPVTLADWQLTLPLAGRKGDAEIVNPAAATPPWLTTGPGGTLNLWAPVTGTTTPNSTHTRTELDNHTPFIAGVGRHTLTATLAVTQLPAERPDVIVGQIHGSDSISSIPFVLLHDENGQIGVVVKQARSGPDGTSLPLLDKVPLNTLFGYTITDNGDNTMTFTATSDGHTATATAQIPPAFHAAPVRFQAGDYQQADSTVGGSGPNDGARVTFHALTVS